MDKQTTSYKRNRFLFILILTGLSILAVTRICRKENTPAGPPPGDMGEKTAAVTPSENDTLTFRAKVRKGMTLDSILKNESLDNETILEMISVAGDLVDLRKIRTGNEYSVTHDMSGFRSFRYDLERNRYFEIFRGTDGGFKGRMVIVPYKTKYSVIQGVIDGSLYETLAAAEPNGGELSENLASLFEYDIDFNRDIRRGDSFSIFAEKYFLYGKFAGYGRIISAEFINRGKKTSVIRFAAEEGKSSYYHPDGRAVKKMFLRCPLPFMRLTSSFGFRRHPVLGFSAAHNGIDLGAPTGTTVRSTADGRVFAAGYDRVRGRYIIIAHGNRYRTHYFHLSGIKKGIATGRSVNQGTVIGYVGSTGRSTGPHLHYGLQQSGRYVNPLRLNSPSREPVGEKDMDRFLRYSGMILNLMDLGRSDIPGEDLKQTILRTGVSILSPHI